MPKLQKTVTPDGIALLKVPCPEEIFDVTDAYVMRRKRVAIHKLDTIAAFKPGQEEEMYDVFAELIPHWRVPDVETGESLPDLADDPAALTRIDTEQLAWLAKMLRQTPSQLASASPKLMSGQM
ncbi:MAG: hypothetical protein IPM39_29550 [Chloroflexi bacterium]|nr:hypothetical protein [Chloroflexota bacterium]